MKILLVWPTPQPEIEVLIKELTNAGHEIVYWVGYHSVSHLTPKGAIFHDHYDAWDGKPANALKGASFPPPSLELIERLYRTESIVLSMMDKHYDTAPVNERKHIYYSMLSYWTGVLDAVNPDAVVFAIVPHTVYNYILYELARLRELPHLVSKTLMLGRIFCSMTIFGLEARSYVLNSAVLPVRIYTTCR